jgi:uncharacterized Zn-binding protein involved in type VI secretion
MVTVLVPHVGGPILPPGAPTVLVGMLPAATVTNMATCVGPPDVIIMGSMGVFINFLPAARMGDQTAHGGVIVLGEPTVMTGEMGAPSPGAGGLSGVVAGLVASGVARAQLAIASELAKSGTQGSASTLPPPGVVAIITAEVANSQMEAQGLAPAWMPGTMVTVAVVPAGKQFPQIIDPADVDDFMEGNGRPGQWASPAPNYVPNQSFAREEQAILPQFKRDVSTSITLETTQPTMVQMGIAGPMSKMNKEGQMETGRGGGGQVRFMAPPGQRPLTTAGQPTILPES